MKMTGSSKEKRTKFFLNQNVVGDLNSEMTGNVVKNVGIEKIYRDIFNNFVVPF